MPELTRTLIPGNDGGTSPIVLLHGSEGAETDLLPLAARLAPTSPRIGIRGEVGTGAGHAFVHRLPDGRVDEADIAVRAPRLAAFIRSACADHDLPGRPVAVGFSNGAIMAAALVLLSPDLLAAAVLLRPLSPFTDDSRYRRARTPTLVIDGADDERRSPGDGTRLADRLRRAGAPVTHHVLAAGHAITGEDERIARDWLRSLPRT